MTEHESMVVPLNCCKWEEMNLILSVRWQLISKSQVIQSKNSSSLLYRALTQNIVESFLFFSEVIQFNSKQILVSFRQFSIFPISLLILSRISASLISALPVASWLSCLMLHRMYEQLCMVSSCVSIKLALCLIGCAVKKRWTMDILVLTLGCRPLQFSEWHKGQVWLMRLKIFPLSKT